MNTSGGTWAAIGTSLTYKELLVGTITSLLSMKNPRKKRTMMKSTVMLMRMRRKKNMLKMRMPVIQLLCQLGRDRRPVMLMLRVIGLR